MTFFCSQRNNISSLSLLLTNVTDLRWLILDHNQLQSDKLEQAALQNQTQLYYFFANNNHLSSVPNHLPAGLKQLRLAYNQISSIKPGTFNHLQNLTLLLLQGNRLQTIAEGELKGFVMCHFLSLYTLNLILPWKVNNAAFCSHHAKKIQWKQIFQNEFHCLIRFENVPSVL